MQEEDETNFEGDDEDDADTQPYYRQSQLRPTETRKGCLAIVWQTCLHIIVTHIALGLCLGAMLLGGSILVHEIARLGWHGISTIFCDGVMILAYIVIVTAVVAVVSRLGKRITKDENF